MKKIVCFILLLGIVSLLLLLTQTVDGNLLSNDNVSGRNIYRMEDLTAPQIDALDRNKTLFIIPVGMLEQHGPHLPIGSDTFAVSNRVQDVCSRLSKDLPDWNILLMPIINYGEGGANEIGNIQIHPGTYSIRHSTLRALVADIAGQIAENKFKWIFLIHGHAGPNHNRALNDACDFISTTFKITMLNISSISFLDTSYGSSYQEIAKKYYSSEEIKSFGLDIHAGLVETSAILAIKPELVKELYKSLPNQTGNSLEEIRKLALSPEWKGYFSSPA
ncbi:MAG: creatininase family protein, partial [Acidobacteriota bacterium]